MIEIREKNKCCGCGACAQICPKRCISMKSDDEGFLYPDVDKSSCVDCGRCEAVCPYCGGEKNASGATHTVALENGAAVPENRMAVPCTVVANDDAATDNGAAPAFRPLQTLAAINPDLAIRMKSSSGGVFSLLAADVIAAGGAVFGAVFDKDWNVRHAMAETSDAVAAMRGSKYVQSVIGNTYRKVKERLHEDRLVLFSGMPCQVEGLKRFLGREYANLIAVDFVCHGVPSKMVWQAYLRDVIRFIDTTTGRLVGGFGGKPSFSNITFRDKQCGWKNYRLRMDFAVKENDNRETDVAKDCITEVESSPSVSRPAGEDPFMRSFLANVCLRPSCYSCMMKGKPDASDITLGDFWGIDKIDAVIDDNKGVSLVLVNTEKGALALQRTKVITKPQSLAAALSYNPSIAHPSARSPYRELFMNLVAKKGFAAAYNRVFSSAISQRIARRLWVLSRGRM